MSDVNSRQNLPIALSVKTGSSVLTEAERYQVLVKWNQTARVYPRERCIHELFEEQVARTPDAPALWFEDKSLSYREVNHRANQLARHLRENHKIRPDALVGLLVKRSLEMVVGILAILKAGGAYVPIDPNYPAERIRFMTEDAGLKVVLGQKAYFKNLPTEVASIDLDEEASYVGSGRNLPPLASPHHLAYVIYTSGSTGKPKGTMVEHAGLVNRLFGMADQLGLGAGDVFLQKTTYSFDVSAWELLLWAVVGAKLILLSPGGESDPQEITQVIEKFEVSIIHFVPSMLRIFLENLGEKKRFPNLKKVICSGEALTVELKNLFFEKIEGSALHNLYGPTEASIDVTSYHVKPEDSIIPIGCPVPNTRAYVLGENGQLLPVKVPGELCFAGVQVARGYLNRPELTAEKFIEDTFHQGERMYRTGDIGRWLPDGNLEYLGRMDDQVKIRGQRIELGEIETALSGLEGVKKAVVVAREKEDGDKELVAYLVAQEQAKLSVDSLRLGLRLKLPDYMIPSRFVAVQAVPLNSNGKIDRKALARSEGVELPSGTDYAAPRDDLERRLVEIWQTVLRRDRIGIRDNFFDLGGHSLLALAMCSRISLRLHLEVRLRQFLENPTIEKLVKSLGESSQNLRTISPIEKVGRQGSLIASFAQQQMWLLQQALPDPATYNEPVAWLLQGRVNREKVRRALRVIMERHEILRTALVIQGTTLTQQIVGSKEISLPWREIEFRKVPADDRETALAELLLSEARQPFDLAVVPLWRAVWIDLGGEETVLAFTFHHSVVDEWSWRLLFQELTTIYAADNRSEPTNLPDLPIQYADYSAWENRQLTGSLLEQQRHYWKEKLSDLPPALELPADRVRPLLSSGRGANHDFQLTGSIVNRLRSLAREEETTLFTVMLAAFQLWLHRYSGQHDLIVGTPISHRQRAEVQSLLGYFLNTLPIRMQLDGSVSFRQFTGQVRKTVLEAFSHASLPFEQIVELAVKERSAGYQPLYQAMFVLLEEAPPPLQLDQAQGRLIPRTTGTSKNDLILDIQAQGDSLVCRFEYATDLFSADCAARMARHFTELLRSITATPEKPISQLNLLLEEERHQILAEWNQTGSDYPRGKGIHELFEEQAKLNPDAVAVVFDGKFLSYRELNIKADLLGHHLQNLGAQKNDLIGLQVERSFEMVIGLLGILKAGGVYWALEEKLPEERFRVMLADAKPRVLLVGRKFMKALAESASKLLADSPTPIPAITAIEDLLELNPGETAFTPPSVHGTDPAYVSYTSGSTGRPKGVVVPHRGVVRLVKNTNYASLNANETFLHLSPLSFDASTFEIWGALLNGGQVVLMPPVRPSLGGIGDAIRQYGVTTLWLTTGLFHLMVVERPDDLKLLRQLLTGGDVLSPEHVREALRILPGCRIINGYGPTENTTFTCCHTIADESDLSPSVPIGRPIANTQVYILDSARQPVPVGVAGELYAGGDGVTRGYLNQPVLTAERFFRDPFNLDPDARLYRTGDRARWRPDGTIEFLGRLDSQVKIRGFRIELGEIEAALLSQAEVGEAAVLAHETWMGDKKLVAYLVAKNGEKPDDLILRTQLAEKLPEYMVPNAFIWLARLPLTTAGKVDRKTLSAMDSPLSGTAREISEPTNLLELELTRIWQRLFQRDDIGRKDNFFALGGQSLLATRLAAAIDKLLGCKLPIAALFQSPTIESLASRLTQENWVPAWSSLVPLQPLGSNTPLFCVHGSGGSVYFFLDVIKSLGLDQPSYGIQPVGLDGKTARHTSVEQMAAHYAKEIVSLQSKGPINLVGYSMGGVIAYEVAQQLSQLGRRVEVLALLDTRPVGPVPTFFFVLSMSRIIRSRFLYHLRRSWKISPREWFDYLAARWSSLRRRMAKNLPKPPPVTIPPEKSTQAPVIPGFMDYYHAVASVYRLRPYPGSLDIFVCEETDPGLRWYWRYLTQGRVSFHRIPGSHGDILSQQNRPVLIKAFKSVLERAQQK